MESLDSYDANELAKLYPAFFADCKIPRKASRKIPKDKWVYFYKNYADRKLMIDAKWAEENIFNYVVVPKKTLFEKLFSR